MAVTLNPAVDVPGLLLRVKELEEQHLAFRNSLVCAFNQMLDLKDINTGVHSTRLAEWALRVARKMDIPEDRLYQVEVAALLHDVGKIGVPDAILKKAGPLTPEERALINRHPEYSWSVLRLFPGLEEASLYALHHHESMDGAGYPAGLKGSDPSPNRKPPTSSKPPAPAWPLPSDLNPVALLAPAASVIGTATANTGSKPHS